MSGLRGHTLPQNTRMCSSTRVLACPCTKGLRLNLQFLVHPKIYLRTSLLTSLLIEQVMDGCSVVYKHDCQYYPFPSFLLFTFSVENELRGRMPMLFPSANSQQAAWLLEAMCSISWLEEAKFRLFLPGNLTRMTTLPELSRFGQKVVWH